MTGANAATDTDATLALARRLIFALGLRNEDDYRLAVLKRVARRFGDDYPEFLRLLLLVACSHDVRARRRLAQTLAVGLKRGDVPSGRLSSWGASTLGASPDGASRSDDSFSAGELTGRFFRGAPQRSLGPLEYLTVWYGQRTQRHRLGAQACHFALARLIDLIGQNEDAAIRYVARLSAESERQIEGTYTEATRRAMRRMAAAWRDGADPEAIAAAATGGGQDGPDPATPTTDWVIRPL